MLVDGVLRILDADEGQISFFKATHRKVLEVCRETGAILDLATSDVVIYLENANREVAERCFPGATLHSQGPNHWCVF